MKDSIFVKIRKVTVNKSTSKKESKNNKKDVPLIMEPLDRELADRVYDLDKGLDGVIQSVLHMREKVPKEAIDRLNDQLDAFTPTLK
jgi:septation ring formation regulator EzrA